jgi:phosphatidylinositol-3-phosphatase
LAARHVLVIMEENKGYKATLGSCGADPYFCSLAAKYTSFTNSHGVGHPSMPNYYAFISGATQGCTNDGCAPFRAPSLGSQLDAAGVPWTAYMESMPSACDRNDAGGYVVKHDPFVQSAAIVGCASHVLPYPGSSGLLAALDRGSAGDFVFITPNLTDDMHDGSVQQGDAWLKANVASVLTSPWFLRYNSTVIVTMDEGDAGPTNQVPTVVISSDAAGIGAVSTSINHYAVLRAIEAVYGLGHLGNAASAPDISNFFG